MPPERNLSPSPEDEVWIKHYDNQSINQQMDESFTIRSMKYIIYSEFTFHANFSYLSVTRKTLKKSEKKSEKKKTSLNINENKTSSVSIK